MRPVKAPRKKIPLIDVAAGIIQDSEGRMLIAQRPTDKMLGGLWEFPGGKVERDETLEECLTREIFEELDIKIAVGPRFGVVKHSFTHFRMKLFVFICRYVSGTPRLIGCSDFAWVTIDELERYAFPVADRKIIASLQRGERQMSLFEE
jgi:A/G-specific adenine glycosylase